MPIKWRKWNNILHRDLGYIFFAMTVIYSVSGIALNHIADWNPSYIIEQHDVEWDGSPTGGPASVPVSRDAALDFLGKYDLRDDYKSHYHPTPSSLKIFIDGGSIDIDLRSGHGRLETIRRRPIFYEVNFLHYNPRGLWMWFSDIFCVCLIIISITGLFVPQGPQGDYGPRGLADGPGDCDSDRLPGAAAVGARTSLRIAKRNDSWYVAPCLRTGNKSPTLSGASAGISGSCASWPPNSHWPKPASGTLSPLISTTISGKRWPTSLRRSRC